MAYEDFTTFIETDPNADLTVIANKIDIDTMVRAVSTHVTKDYGVDHFGDFEHYLKQKVTTGDATGFFTPELLSVGAGHDTIQDILDNNDGLAYYNYRNGVGGIYWTKLRDAFNDNEDLGSFTLNTDYWYKFKRDGALLTVHIYSDSDMLILVDTLSVVCEVDTLQYLSVAGSRDNVGADTVTGYVENLDINETPTPASNKKIPNYFDSQFVSQ